MCLLTHQKYLLGTELQIHFKLKLHVPLKAYQLAQKKKKSDTASQSGLCTCKMTGLSSLEIINNHLTCVNTNMSLQLTRLGEGFTAEGTLMYEPSSVYFATSELCCHNCRPIEKCKPNINGFSKVVIVV